MYFPNDTHRMSSSIHSAKNWRKRKSFEERKKIVPNNISKKKQQTNKFKNAKVCTQFSVIRKELFFTKNPWKQIAIWFNSTKQSVQIRFIFLIFLIPNWNGKLPLYKHNGKIQYYSKMCQFFLKKRINHINIFK